MPHDDEHDLIARFEREFTQLVMRQDHISFKILPREAWIIMSQLQLALRHPHITGDLATRTEHLARRLQSLVADRGALAIIAERGWQPHHDTLSDVPHLRRDRAIANGVADLKHNELPALRKDIERWQAADDWLWGELARRFGHDETDQLRQLYADVRGEQGP